MSKPYKKPNLPKWPARPFTPIDYTQPAGYLGPPGPDGECLLWGFAEACAIADDHALRYPGTMEANACRNFIDTFGKTPIQVQTTAEVFDLSEQQAASLAAGCTVARMYGAGMTGVRPALHANLSGGPPTPINGYAVSNANYNRDGDMTYEGVGIEDIPKLAFDALVADVHKGFYSK